MSDEPAQPAGEEPERSGILPPPASWVPEPVEDRWAVTSGDQESVSEADAPETDASKAPSDDALSDDLEPLTLVHSPAVPPVPPPDLSGAWRIPDEPAPIPPAEPAAESGPAWERFAAGPEPVAKPEPAAGSVPAAEAEPIAEPEPEPPYTTSESPQPTAGSGEEETDPEAQPVNQEPSALAEEDPLTGPAEHGAIPVPTPDVARSPEIHPPTQNPDQGPELPDPPDHDRIDVPTPDQAQEDEIHPPTVTDSWRSEPTPASPPPATEAPASPPPVTPSWLPPAGDGSEGSVPTPEKTPTTPPAATPNVTPAPVTASQAPPPPPGPAKPSALATLAAEHPEALVGGAFLGGFLLAQVIKRLAR